MRYWELDSSADELDSSADESIVAIPETTFSVDRGAGTANKLGGLYCSPLHGGPGGSFWNDGTYSGIRRITLTATERTLTSLQLAYGIEGDMSVKNRYVHGVRHGGTDGEKIVYDLNYPEEIVTKISGYYGTHQFWFQTFVIVKSLTFHTNERKLGPCGPEHGTYFETNEQEGKIIGIHGFGSIAFVDSIGVYMMKS